MPYATPYYQIAIDKSKITSDLTNFVLPIRITTTAGYPAYDIATPFFAALTSNVLYENFESYPVGYQIENATSPNWVTGGLSSTLWVVDGLIYRQGSVSLKYSGDNTDNTLTCAFTGGAQPAAGQCSFWFLTNVTLGQVNIKLREGANNGAYLKLFPVASSGYVTSLYPGSTSNTVGTGYVANVWYKILIEWRTSPSQGIRITTYNNDLSEKDHHPYAVPPGPYGWHVPSVAWATGIQDIQFEAIGASAYTDAAKNCYLDDILITQTTDYSKKYTITNQYGTELPIERIAFDAVNQQCYMFVKVDNVSSVLDTKLYLWVDKTHADNVLIGTTTEAATHNVWPSEYRAVYHLEDDLSASGLQIKDSTVYQNDAQKNGALIAANTVAAFNHNGISFEGTSSYLSAASSVSLQLVSSFSVCTAVRCRNLTGTTSIINKWNVSGNNCSWKLEAVAGKIKVSFGNPTTGTADYYTVTTDNVYFLSDAQYYVVGFSFEAGATLPVKIYVNGSLVSSTITTGTEPAALYNATGATLGIAASSNGGGGDFFYGIIDETRILSGVMSDAWFRAIYHGLNDDLVRFNVVSNQMTHGYVYINPATTNPVYYPSAPTWNYATTGEILRNTIIPTLEGETGNQLINTVTPTLTGQTGLELLNTVTPTLRAEVGYVTNSLAVGYITFNVSANMAEFYTLSATLPPLVMDTNAGASGAYLDKKIPTLDIAAHAFRWEWANLRTEAAIPALEAGEMFVGAVLSSLHSLPPLSISASAQIDESAYLLATSFPALTMAGNAYVGIIASLNAKLSTLKSTAETSNDVHANLSKSLPLFSLAGYAVPQGFTYLSKSIPALELTGFTYNNPLANLSASLPALLMEEEDSYAYVAGRFDDYTLQYTR